MSKPCIGVRRSEAPCRRHPGRNPRQCPGACVNQGHTGETAAEAAAAEGIALHVVKRPEAKRGFVLLPRHRVVERSFAWATRCRRLVQDHERYATTLAGFHV